MSEMIIGHGNLPQLGAAMRAAGLRGRAFVFTDEVVARHHAPAVLEALRAVDYDAALCVLPSGEPTKSLEQAFRAYDWLVEQRAERQDTIVALGGGVIGDLAGFVAATYLRGVALVQVPTNLLAQIDSAIGGKTAVNHPRGKNLVGAFHPARLIFSDTALSRTLPPREVSAGWVEAIKAALILDADLLDLIEQNVDALLALEPEVTTEVIRRSAQLKVDVTTKDLRESDLRIILNYGHTIGHALEAATAYGAILHGEGVAIGMNGAAQISRDLGILAPEVVKRQNALLRRFGLPIQAAGFLHRPPHVEDVLAAMRLDKKVSGAAIRWVLLEDVGRTRVEANVPDELVRRVVAGLLA